MASSIIKNDEYEIEQLKAPANYFDSMCFKTGVQYTLSGAYQAFQARLANSVALHLTTGKFPPQCATGFTVTSASINITNTSGTSVYSGTATCNVTWNSNSANLAYLFTLPSNVLTRSAVYGCSFDVTGMFV